MKMLMMIVESSCKEELEVLLNRNEVVGYTEISQVYGSGESGPRLGSRAFPKTSSIVFSVVPREKAEKVASEVKHYCDDCGKDMTIITWNAERID